MITPETLPRKHAAHNTSLAFWGLFLGQPPETLHDVAGPIFWPREPTVGSGCRACVVQTGPPVWCRMRRAMVSSNSKTTREDHKTARCWMLSVLSLAEVPQFFDTSPSRPLHELNSAGTIGELVAPNCPALGIPLTYRGGK